MDPRIAFGKTSVAAVDESGFTDADAVDAATAGATCVAANSTVVAICVQAHAVAVAVCFAEGTLAGPVTAGPTVGAFVAAFATMDRVSVERYALTVAIGVASRRAAALTILALLI